MCQENDSTEKIIVSISSFELFEIIGKINFVGEIYQKELTEPQCLCLTKIFSILLFHKNFSEIGSNIFFNIHL